MKKMIFAATIAAALFTVSFANAQETVTKTTKVHKEKTMHKKAVTTDPATNKTDAKMTTTEKKTMTKETKKTN